MFRFYSVLILFLTIGNVLVYSQQLSISENKKIRYLKKIEKKNERFVWKQKQKNQNLLEKLITNEKKLAALPDLTSLHQTISINDFNQIKERLIKNKKTKNNALADSSFYLPLSTIPLAIDFRIKDYLKQQITMYNYLVDSTTVTSKKLKCEVLKAKQNILETESQLAQLQSIEKETKNYKEILKNKYSKLPQAADQLKKIDKNTYYFNQGMDGFKSIYTNPSQGIESKLAQTLTFNKDYLKFAGQLGSQGAAQNIIGGSTPDLSGYQTKAQVQKLLPQNAQGITAEQKATLIANMQNSLTKFKSLRDKQSNISALKDKPSFKINPYKGLPIKQRLVFGKEFQIHPKNKYYPIIADMGITLGFKLTTRLTPLIGVSYKQGIGKDLTHLQYSSEGIVARGGFDCKIAYGFSIQCLYEETWKMKQIMVNEKPGTMQDPSFIVGIMNKCKIGKKTYSTIMVGYDFFYMKHTPYTTPWIIRVGWQ